MDIRVLDENQARIWIIGLKRVLSSQRILRIPQDFYINQPFSFQKFLNNLRQKSWETGVSIANLIIKIHENSNSNRKKEGFYRYNQKNSVNNYKYLSMGGKKETLKSIESYINPLNEENFKEKPEKIPLRRSQTERNFINKAHNSLKTRQIHDIDDNKEKENQDIYNYQPNTSINCFKKQQKTKIKLSFDKTSLKQKVWALMKENQENKSFITNQNNDSFAGNSMKRNSNEINRDSIENLTIEIADLDLISPKKQENMMNLTEKVAVQEEFDNLNVRKNQEFC